MMTDARNDVVAELWTILSEQMEKDPVQRVAVRHLIPLTGKRYLTGRARVRIADALISRGFTFEPKSVLTEKEHGDRSELYIFGPGSQLGRALRLAENPSEGGEKQLQALERQLRLALARKTPLRRNLVKSGRQYLWNA
jgi:hypothetical protein